MARPSFCEPNMHKVAATSLLSCRLSAPPSFPRNGNYTALRRGPAPPSAKPRPRPRRPPRRLLSCSQPQGRHPGRGRFPPSRRRQGPLCRLGRDSGWRRRALHLLWHHFTMAYYTFFQFLVPPTEKAADTSKQRTTCKTLAAQEHCLVSSGWGSRPPSTSTMPSFSFPFSPRFCLPWRQTSGLAGSKR